MDHNRSREAWLNWLFLPFEIIRIPFIRLEQLRVDDRVVLFLLATFNLLVVFVLKVEPDWQLEVQLDGTALMRPLQRIEQLDIDLRAVEGTVSWVQLPGLSKVVECFLQRFLGFVPLGIVTEPCLWPRGELEFILESKNAVNVLQEIEDFHDLDHDLLHGTKDMGIILLEASDTSKSGQGTGHFISMKDAKITKSDW